MIKIFFLNSGVAIVADEEMKYGKRFWKTPLQLSYEGTKIQFKNLFHYSKGNDFYPRDPDILFEDEADSRLATHYATAVERFIASKAGIVLADDVLDIQGAARPERRLAR